MQEWYIRHAKTKANAISQSSVLHQMARPFAIIALIMSRR